jgi:hypothetical protein
MSSAQIQSLLLGNAVGEARKLPKKELSRVRLASFVIANPMLAVVAARSIGSRGDGSAKPPLPPPGDAAADTAVKAADDAGKSATTAKAEADASRAARREAEAAAVSSGESAVKAAEAAVAAAEAAATATAAASEAKTSETAAGKLAAPAKR